MEILNETIQAYLDQHCEKEPELLRHINRQTHLKVPMPRMLSGHFQGRLLSLLSKMIRPKRILEIGTFTGYATLCLAEGLVPEGIIHTIDINEEIEDLVNQHFKQSPFKDKIKYHVGSALDIIPRIAEKFDLVFIDADKKNNGTYYDLVFDMVTPGGIILIDNVLWSGKVLTELKDSDSNSIRNFNEKVTKDQRTEKLIFPIRDGLFIVRKL
jgi:predicted O-methyltransferase YrrM